MIPCSEVQHDSNQRVQCLFLSKKANETHKPISTDYVLLNNVVEYVSCNEIMADPDDTPLAIKFLKLLTKNNFHFYIQSR